ncbi:MAG: adenylosuccinate lyase, partial [candidate division Zixibacteria bacterium]
MIERYTLPEMGQLWSEENKFKNWLKVEIEAARAMAQIKMIPAAAARSIEKKAKFKVSEIDRIEKEVNHDVLAFLTSVSKSIGSHAKYLHFGLTSSDVVDTALSLRIKEAAGIIDKKLAEAIKLVKQLAKKYKNVPCIGRTHGVLAEPMTVGLKFSVWYTELKRSQLRFRNATTGISVGKLSGAVGNFANVDPKVEAAVCKRLGLKAAEVSTQVIQRDRHAAFITSIAILGSSLEKFATEIRNLQRTEIGEMYEGFTKGQKGSSSMPHKKNPITAERITGIARLLRGYALSAMENIPLWHERDIAHSSVERVIIPDATTLIDYSLHKFIGLM